MPSRLAANLASHSFMVMDGLRSLICLRLVRVVLQG